MNLPQCEVFLVKVPFNLIVQMTETKEVGGEKKRAKRELLFKQYNCTH